MVLSCLERDEGPPSLWCCKGSAPFSSKPQVVKEDAVSTPISGGLEAWPDVGGASNPARSKSISSGSNIRGDSAGGVSGIGGVALGGSGTLGTGGVALEGSERLGTGYAALEGSERLGTGVALEGLERVIPGIGDA